MYHHPLLLLPSKHIPRPGRHLGSEVRRCAPRRVPRNTNTDHVSFPSNSRSLIVVISFRSSLVRQRAHQPPRLFSTATLRSHLPLLIHSERRLFLLLIFYRALSLTRLDPARFDSTRSAAATVTLPFNGLIHIALRQSSHNKHGRYIQGRFAAPPRTIPPKVRQSSPWYIQRLEIRIPSQHSHCLSSRLHPLRHGNVRSRSRSTRPHRYRR